MAKITDNFNRPNDGLGGSWTNHPSTTINGQATSNLQIESNQIAGTGLLSRSVQLFTPQSLPPKQYAKLTYSTKVSGGTQYMGVILRANFVTKTWYEFIFSQSPGNDTIITRVNAAGTSTQLAILNNLWSPGDVLRAEADGSTLRLFKNETKLIEVTDSTYPDGQAGAWAFPVSGSVTNLLGDNWEAGSLGDLRRGLYKSVSSVVSAGSISNDANILDTIPLDLDGYNRSVSKITDAGNQSNLAN